MSESGDETKLQRCFEAIISSIHVAISDLKTDGHIEANSSADSPLTNTALDVNIHVFTLDKAEEDAMQELQTNLESILTDNISRLSKVCRKYLLDFLYEFNYVYNERKFKTPFNIGILDSFLRETQSMLDSLKAFQAAWDGNLDKVQEFIKKYPNAKDKSGLWGTTLLYSAARNDRINIVKYLIKTARCSVNAQNQQHIMRVMPGVTTFSTEDYTANPTAGSSALHGACFQGHLKIVKFLVENKADCFLLNHAHETPIMNASARPEILKFFREYLILGYSRQTTSLPDQPIVEDGSKIVDCFWEYKPFADEKWYQFTDYESTKLQKALLPEPPDNEFKQEIHLAVLKGVYSVSMIKFLRSGKDQDYAQNLAWVRCRGSSILNFDCYAIWQIMCVKHPQGQSDLTLEMLTIPTIYDSKFVLHLNSWYYCDARTNSHLEQTMNYRQKEINLDLPIFKKEQVKFNLQTFTFANDDESIRGYIRWIPKMISNNPKHKDKIIGIDQYESLANLDPVPLTTARFKKSSDASIQDTIGDDDEELGEYINDDDDDDDNDDENNSSITTTTSTHKNFADTSEKTSKRPTNAPRSIEDLLNTLHVDSDTATNNDTTFNQQSATTTKTSRISTSRSNASTTSSSDDVSDKNIDDCINESAAQVQSIQEKSLVERTAPTADDKAIAKMNSDLAVMNEENRKLQNKIDSQRAKVQEMLESKSAQSAKHQQELQELINRIEQMEEEQQKNKRKETKFQQLAKNIKSIEYNNIQKEVIHDFLTPKNLLILNRLRNAVHNIDSSFADRIPRMIFDEKNDQYIVTISGFLEHHDEFKAILQRIWSLLNLIKSAKDFYQRYLNRVIRSIMTDALAPIKCHAKIWREYKQLFGELLKAKTIEYKKQFDEYLQEKIKPLQDPCIEERLTKPWNDIRSITNTFMKKVSIMNEIESLKQQALDDFIKRNIIMQRLKLDSEATVKSATVVSNFIQKVQKEFRTDKKYQGHETRHFSLIPKLLERLMLYHSCFTLQLPLYESSEELLDKIEKNAVTTISTSTGSGKSTLLPALLVAEGYDKVIVTQPRRLPCQLICKRVNKTMMTDIGTASNHLAGWAVSGAESNPQAKVLYLTDGLLKERLLYDEHFITTHTQLNKSVVFFVDEVHERSVNIDLCLALLARLLTNKPELKSKMKVIISSATLNASVPDLFRKIPQAGLAEFQMPQMGTLHRVDTISRPNENVLDIVQELCKKRKRHDQILCFVSSVSEVNQCTRLINDISRGTIVAYPLVQSQHPNVQQENIEHGTVFFSTTVAETSLTFPSLKYVVDTGMINTPVYDVESKRTVLKELRAAESTIKQRRGRLGRTQTGEYYALYSFKPEALKYPIPQICQSDLMNLEFSLRKSPLKKGLEYVKQFLPDRPSQPAINSTLKQLQRLGILSSASSDQLTKDGKLLSKLPDFGSLAMSKAVLAALMHYNCGRDLIYLSSMLGVLNTTVIFKSIPQNFKSPDGDFMTLLNVMNEVLLVKQSVPPKQFDFDRVCTAKGLRDIQHIIRQAFRRYTTLEKLFNLSDDFREAAQVISGDWELVAKSLLDGYYDNVFVSKRELHDKHLHFERYNGEGDAAILDLQSTLTRPINSAPVSLILARDIRHSTAVRATAILSFVGEIKPEWLEHQLERRVQLSNEEETYLNSDSRYTTALSKFSSRINMQMGSGTLLLKGPSGTVLNAELHLRQQMISELKFNLRDLATAAAHQNFERNLESVMKMTRIFNPMKWRWQAQKQVEITINSNTATKTCEITVKGRDSENKKVRQEFSAFIGWLQVCAVIRHPNAGLSPRVLRPQMRKNCQDIEDRIGRITDSKRTTIELYNGTKGVKATRETRMEVVGWIAVCKFDCTLEGGFVRDWVINRDVGRPTAAHASPKGWIQYANTLPALDKEVVPCDLDCHLPSHAYFDIDKFQDELYKYDISCKVCYDNWRYVLLLDEDAPTGPFTMDLIEPHVALTQDRIDFDVNNLSLEKDYTHELGMRIDIAQKPYSIELETIVDNIKHKRFQILRPVDNNLRIRIDKMVNVRKWTLMDSALSVIPQPHFKYHAILVPLPRSAVLYTEICTKMARIPGAKIVSIEEIRNPSLEETYEGMKKLIKKQCPAANPNEQELFHGTKSTGIEGITEDGYDDRFFNTGGLYGHGAYFADDPQKSHGYTSVDSSNNTHVMFYNKVTLGVPSVLTATNNTLVSAPKGFHSVIGKHTTQTEYIIYRYGQALPYLKIVYTG